MKVSYDFLCLDERDSPNLTELRNNTRKEIRNIKNRRFFGICGVIIPGAVYPQLNVEGRKIQEQILGKGKYRPFHYVEILNNSKFFSFLGKDESKRQSLIAKLNNLITKTKFKIIASFVDKQTLALNYGVFPKGKLTKITKIKPNLSKPTTPRTINLYEICLKSILKDYYEYLSKRNKRGLIIAEARGEKEDKELLDAFYSYQKTGAGSLSGKQIRERITDLLIIRKSQNHIGTQVADLITYPLYDYFIPDHNIRSDHLINRKSFEDKIISIKVFPKLSLIKQKKG